MRTALEIAMARAEDVEVIPRMTHELSSAWDQPDRSKIQIDDQYALMSRRTFDALKEYSASNPSGVYEGKMWKRNDGAHDYGFIASGGKPEWLFVWFGKSDKPDCCSINYRTLLVVD